MSVSKIEIAECKSEADMYLFEIYYINRLKPMLNRDDKAFDDLTLDLPNLKFEVYNPKLMDKWKEQIQQYEAEKLQKKIIMEEYYSKKHEARKQLKGDAWYDWLDANPQPC